MSIAHEDPPGIHARRHRVALVLATFACLTSSARAQSIPMVNGEPGDCFGGATGICLVGGRWSVSGAFFEVTGAARITLPNGLVIRLPNAVTLRVGTTTETASVVGTAGLALDTVTSGPLAGIGVAGPNVTLTIGEGRDLGVRQFALGSTAVSSEPSWYYLYARFGGETRMTLPVLGTVPVPTPGDGLSSQLLVGFDPARPENMVVYLGGGFTTLLTGGTIANGAVLFAWGANTTIHVGPFVTSATRDTTQSFALRPTFSARGAFGPFGGGDAARKPLPITISGGIALDVDGDRDGRRLEAPTDMRFASEDARIAIDDVGLGQRIDVGTGDVYYDPSACNGPGQLLARVDAVRGAVLVNTPLSFLDPGAGGFTFDALACGAESMVRLSASTVSIAGEDVATPFPLTDVAIGFAQSGISVEASLAFFGSTLRLRGTLEGRSLRLRSSAALTLGGLPISSGAVELVVASGRASVRLTGVVTIAGQRFGIDETFRSPNASFSLP